MTIQINEMALLSEKEVQEIYKLNARTLQRDRVLGRGIPYVKIGRRVRYKRSDIEKYIKRHTVGDYSYD
jgi:predicted DNA-binding transcriptional regulator AlpA|tara:strand:+ start:254 stop:460 length:207 start_codon:yes stop_codon:yes gene_type:complete